MDKTSFFWTGQCGACHPGGGPSEFDRDGQLYYDVLSDQYGYEKLGKTPGQVALDGDYAFINPGNGVNMPAPWHVTGISEADCLLCHRSDRTLDQGNDMNGFWRQATLRGMANLMDSSAQSVPAYAAAATAAQGWHSTFTLASLPPGKPPTAAVLDVDYGKGLQDGSLRSKGGTLYFSGARLTKAPRDYACWSCHALPDLKKRGRVWFDPDQDVHYAAFNNLDDADPSNDVGKSESKACTVCHGASATHNFAKGNAFAGSVQNETDFTELRTCRDCHLADSPLKHPAAPPPSSAIHKYPKHLARLSCQLCHAPYKTVEADLVVDNAVTGNTIGYKTEAFLSADPLDPTSIDKSRWYPSIHWKTDKDGVQRLFPAKLLDTVWWGDWDQNGTPGTTADDVIQPVILWRLRQATGGAALPGVSDDNGDGRLEVNSEAEILAYIQELRTFLDSYGTPIAVNPVLVKGEKVWYEDGGAPGGVSTLDLHGSGIKAETAIPFSIDHNVLPTHKAIASCSSCHQSLNGWQPTEVFDRKVLIDPFDLAGDPVYETPRDRLGLGNFN